MNGWLVLVVSGHGTRVVPITAPDEATARAVAYGYTSAGRVFLARGFEVVEPPGPDDVSPSETRASGPPSYWAELSRFFARTKP